VFNYQSGWIYFLTGSTKLVQGTVLLTMRFLFLSLLLALMACSGERPQLQQGSLPPSFSAETLDGRTVQVPDGVKGQVVVIRFWADWCPFCYEEMRDIEQVYRDLKGQGLTILAVNVGQDRDTAKRFVERTGISYTALLDPDSVTARAYGVIGLPTSFFIDRQGRIHSKILGESNAAMFRRGVEPLL
jgi:cytochrome c biogenesis protein CcmG, thiol:disulfide interchange protein DsbE